MRNFWNRLFEKNKKIKPKSSVNVTPKNETNTLKLKCPKCGMLYNIGVNAGLITNEYVKQCHLSGGGSVIIIRDDTASIKVDLVSEITTKDENEMRNAKKIALENLNFVIGDLQKGNKRKWWCQTCMNHDSPYNYPF